MNAMEVSGEVSLIPSQQLMEILARTLRHEVGDLLQTVYSTVAILQDRLPADQTLERRLLSDLKGRAENCKHELDAMVDLICPLSVSPAPLDLTETVGSLVASFSRRFPQLRIGCETSAPVVAQADARRLTQVLSLLFLSACQVAQQRVVVRTAAGPGAGEVELSIDNDGPGATPDQLEWLIQPFTTTHHALFGLGVALARRVLALHGGRVAVENLPAGGYRIRLIFPAAPSS